MAGIGSYSCLIVFFLLSEIVILSPALAVPLPPLPRSTKNFLEQCAAKLQTGCGNQLVASLFGAGTVSPACCHNLATFGRPCYDEFLVVSLPYHKEVDATKVIAKSEKVWNDCATVKPSA
ncbi:hypothetical protein Dsin_014792 [Dipteronia sinensis]|uniref:Prolamin-like domain-containing protein n=1 Tax=Dipteronia sinensis TaxID=43782 RepID=A0AAE0EAN2_9ROSI|nr:hypothetical protein Dsin_014792 [Dipteronia sinensis]